MFTRFLKLPIHTSLLSAACCLFLLTACGGGDVSTDTAGTTPLISVSAEPAGSHCAAGGSKILAGIDTNSNGVLDSSEIASTAYSCTGMAGANGSNGQTSLVSVVTEAAGANCANGGSKLNIGLDTNANGMLDSAEITSSAYSCHGASGSAGSSGLVSLLSIVAESAGANCAAGGNKIRVGLDANANGLLDSAEVASTSYSCNGVNGTNGSTGSNGANGTNGTNGYNSLINATTLAAGSTCTYGGNQINVGLDSNANGSLDASEITSSSTSCNGAPGATGATGAAGSNAQLSITPESAGSNCTYGGSKVAAWLDTNANSVMDGSEAASASTGYLCNGAGLSWISVTGATQQAAANKGYLALNDSARPTITLPASSSLSVGDTVEVSGLGTQGWKIAQNAGQSIVTSALGSDAIIPAGKTWTAQTAAGNRDWRSIASSADGTKLVAVVYGGQIYTSTDSGVTWTPRESSRYWHSVASSADGTRLAAAVQYGQIYTSTDSGVTWTARASNRNWSSVASSADGTKLVAVVQGGQIYTSTDSGATWTARASNHTWGTVSSSADGTKLVAAGVGNGSSPDGQIYTSTDSGVSWTAHAHSSNWFAVASSADGTRLAAAVQYGQIYTSTDSGVTWTARASSLIWRSVASSADGTKLVAGVWGGQIYTSIDSGVTWTARESNQNWNSVASSADGTKLVAGVYGGTLYTSTASTGASATTAGTAGTLSGDQYEAVSLQYIGNDKFIIRSHEGTLEVE